MEIEVKEEVVKAIITLKEYCDATCCRECAFYDIHPCPVSRFPNRPDIKRKTIYTIERSDN